MGVERHEDMLTTKENDVLSPEGRKAVTFMVY